MLSINNRNDTIFKIISIISFFLILLVLIIIVRVGPASSYEFSIYDAYPWYFWFFIISAIICGQIVIIGSAITQSKKNYWIFGLCAILTSNALLIFMPIIRGYYIYGSGDVLTHIGFMKDILQTSSISRDHYPIDHILGVIIHLISGLSLPDITLLIPPFFSFFFILSVYFVGKTIFKNKFELLILVSLSTVLFFGYFLLSFTPNSQALFLVPLFLYLAFKMYHGVDRKKYNIILLLICFLIVFYHPLVAIMVILLLSLMQIMQYILEKYENKILKKVNYIYTILFTVIIFSIWSTYLRLVLWVVQPIVFRIFGEETTQSELQKKFAILSSVNVDPIYLLKLILNIYGQWILLGIVSLLSIGLILKSMKNHDTELNFYLGSSAISYILLLILSILMFFLNGAFGFSRIYIHTTVFSLLLIPTGVYLFLYNNFNDKSLSRKSIIKLFGIIFFLFCLVNFSIFGLYNSPIIKEANLQVSRGDYIGMSSLFSYRDTSIPTFELMPFSFRYYDAIYGQSSRVNANISEKYLGPPAHFGYQNQTLLNNFYNSTTYLIVNDLGRGYNAAINPEFENMWSFGPHDFERLKFDEKIRKVYSNGNLEFFKVS